MIEKDNENEHDQRTGKPGRNVITTNDGVPVYDNNNTLKAGNRGPSLLEDFIYQDKMAHFDRERIPERVVHARGSGAHGVFEATEDISEYTCAGFLKKGTKTPVFARFSTVVGFKGSTDLPRDVRGFSVKFYTQQGNYDFVGNNIPVFFIQDAMNFPDLVHAIKPEPDRETPQAASAHDTFWDFISLMPESAHMIMWLMSDRAIPRSLRMMQGFSVHTFKFVNEEGKATFVKFHWIPKLGVHSVAWNEAQKISGFNSDFHRQDLWEAIESGHFPQWDLGVQLVPEEDEHKFSFDLLDPTKIIPEELVPVKIIGTMTLNRNPDNFFAETEQAAFHPGRLVPGIDFSNDPLLQGRVFSYADTQLYRLGGPNFHEFPINRPINGKTNHQKDGFARHDILKGKVSYFPNSIANGCPYHAMLNGEKGFTSHTEKVQGEKVRRRSASFADHFTQARLFFHSQSTEEQQHIIDAFSFELSKVTLDDVRSRILAILRQIDVQLASRVGDNLNMEPPAQLDPLTVKFARDNHPEYPLAAPEPEITKSEALSMKVKKGEGTIVSRKIACLISDGAHEASVMDMKSALEKEGATLVLIAPKVGKLTYENGNTVQVAHSLLTDASVLYDGFFVAANNGIDELEKNPDFRHFLNEGFRHCKAIAFASGTEKIMAKLLIEKDEGTVFEKEPDFHTHFIQVLKQHRLWKLEQQRKNPS